MKNLKDIPDLDVRALFPEFVDSFYYDDLKRNQFVFAFPFTPMRT